MGGGGFQGMDWQWKASRQASTSSDEVAKLGVVCMCVGYWTLSVIKLVPSGLLCSRGL